MATASNLTAAQEKKSSAAALLALDNASLGPLRKPLVGAGSGLIKTVLVMAYSHAALCALCVNVAFDLIIYGLPAYVLLLPFSKRIFRLYMGGLINYTTPIVFNLPMILSGTTFHCDSLELLRTCKKTNSLMLANHGSRIDWMMGMYVGYIADPIRCRVGFVCERVIQYMPLIGWYRRIVCEDVFVDRSFKVDKINISSNLNDFHDDNVERMLFLSPEGVVVDFGERDMQYMQACRDFCKDFGVKPFDYVLTPRYKGQTVLVEHVKNGGKITSVTMAFIRDGELLNCEMWSKERVIPDIYTLCAGLGGSPVDIFISIKELNFNADSDIKTIMMQDYVRKDNILREWHGLLKAGKLDELKSRFTEFKSNFWSAQVIQALHGLQLYLFASYFDITSQIARSVTYMFFFIAISHTLGWIMNGTSMESVPFETSIKAVLMKVFNTKHKQDKKSTAKKAN